MRLAIVAVTALALAGCAGTAPSGTPSPPSLGAVTPVPPEGEVTAVGTVLDTGGVAELCLGPVAESYPPQCSGIPLEDWTWEGVEGAESSGDVTWGAYALQGTFDGESFTVTQPPVMLALYDPMAPEDPTGGEPGAGDEQTLARIVAAGKTPGMPATADNLEQVIASGVRYIYTHLPKLFGAGANAFLSKAER